MKVIFLHLRFFLAECTSATGSAAICALCEILFTKYKAKIENIKLKWKERFVRMCIRRQLGINVIYQVVAQTRWMLPHANMVPTKQKQISGNSLAWNESPITIVSKFDKACSTCKTSLIFYIFRIKESNVKTAYGQSQNKKPWTNVSTQNCIQLMGCKPRLINLHSWEQHNGKHRWKHQRNWCRNRWN